MSEENYSIMRIEKIKSSTNGVKRANHNSRKRGEALSDKNDSKPIHLVVPGSNQRQIIDSNMSFTAFAKNQKKQALESGQKSIRKDCVIGFEIVMSFSPGAISDDAILRDWAAESMDWVAQTFGAHNIYSAQLHMSETTPHIHCITGALDARRHLCAKSIINGPAHMSQLQTSYAAAMLKFGLHRGKEKKLTKKKHTDLKDFYARESASAERLAAYERIYGTEANWSTDKVIEFAAAMSAADRLNSDERGSVSQHRE